MSYEIRFANDPANTYASVKDLPRAKTKLAWSALETRQPMVLVGPDGELIGRAEVPQER
jgi:hypothetical protein